MRRWAVLLAGLLLLLPAVAARQVPAPAAASATPDIRPTTAAGAQAPIARRLLLPLLAADGPAPTPFTVAFVGDVSLARGVVSQMVDRGPDYPFARVHDALAADLAVANLEGALTDRGTPWPKGYNFRTPPDLAGGLSAAGFDVLSVANNHSLDFGVEGFEDTLTTLAGLGIRAAGGGPDEAAARAPVVLAVHGQRIAFLARVATPVESDGFAIREWAAGPDSPGLAVGDPASLAADVAAARRVADFVVVLLHAGDEYRRAPNATQRALAEAALAAGADAVIGAHPHVVQPIETRGWQFIAWSLGNFVFDLDEVDRANIPVPRVTLVLRLTFAPGRGVVGYEAVPMTLDETEGRPRPATTEEAAVLAAQLGP